MSELLSAIPMLIAVIMFLLGGLFTVLSLTDKNISSETRLGLLSTSEALMIGGIGIKVFIS